MTHDLMSNKYITVSGLFVFWSFLMLYILNIDEIDDT